VVTVHLVFLFLLFLNGVLLRDHQGKRHVEIDAHCATCGYGVAWVSMGVYMVQCSMTDYEIIPHRPRANAECYKRI
jgi:hypothetical protein